MATSGTVTFDLDIDEVIEEAYEQAGLSLETSYDLKSARRSLDMLLKEWQSEQVHLWKLELITVDLSASTATVTLPTNVEDVLDVAIRDSDGNDTPLERIDYSQYLDIVDKDSSAKPIQFLVQRLKASRTLTLWPVPDVATYDLVYWAIKRIEDAGAYSNQLDIPVRFLPALTAGLAWKLAIKNPAKLVSQDGRVVQVDGVSDAKRAELKQDYLEIFNRAILDDREKTSYMIYPR